MTIWTINWTIKLPRLGTKKSPLLAGTFPSFLRENGYAAIPQISYSSAFSSELKEFPSCFTFTFRLLLNE